MGKLFVRINFIDIDGDGVQSKPAQLIPDGSQASNISYIFYEEFQNMRMRCVTLSL